MPFVHRSDGVNVHRIPDGLADGDPRIEGAVRVLKDDLHSPAEPSQFAGGQGGQVLTVEENASRGTLLKLQDGAGQGGFSAAALPDQREDLVAANDEADIVHGVQDRTAAGGPAHLEVGAELLDHDQIRHRASKGKWHRT